MILSKGGCIKRLTSLSSTLWSGFPLTPKRTFLRPLNVSKTSKLFGVIAVSNGIYMYVQNSRSPRQYTFSFWTLTETLDIALTVNMLVKHLATNGAIQLVVFTITIAIKLTCIIITNTRGPA